MILFQTTCVQTCPAGTYKNDTTCSICADFVLTCTSYETATSCQANYFLLEGQCLSKCPDGTYMNL